MAGDPCSGEKPGRYQVTDEHLGFPAKEVGGYKHTPIEYYYQKLIIHKVKIYGIKARWHDDSATIIWPSNVKVHEQKRLQICTNRQWDDAPNSAASISLPLTSNVTMVEATKSDFIDCDGNGDEQRDRTAQCESGRQGYEQSTPLREIGPVNDRQEAQSCRFFPSLQLILKGRPRDSNKSFTESTSASIDRASNKSCLASVDNTKAVPRHQKTESTSRKPSFTQFLSTKFSYAFHTRRRDAWLIRTNESQRTNETRVMEMVFFDVK